jgi:hypothetical protein
LQTQGRDCREKAKALEKNTKKKAACKQAAGKR